MDKIQGHDQDEFGKCEGCGKPAERFTPDDVGFCAGCWADYCAAGYSELKAAALGLVAVSKDAITAIGDDSSPLTLRIKAAIARWEGLVGRGD